MKIVAQVVDHSSVSIKDLDIYNEIDKGYTLLVGFTHHDTKEIVDAMVKKIVNLRVFVDENDKMNLSIKEVEGCILSISQFTLYADMKKGNRPSFVNAMAPDLSSDLYDYFNEQLRNHDIKVETGVFGSDMVVNIVNHGPITIILDSDEMIKK